MVDSHSLSHAAETRPACVSLLEETCLRLASLELFSQDSDGTCWDGKPFFVAKFDGARPRFVFWSTTVCKRRCIALV